MTDQEPSTASLPIVSPQSEGHFFVPHPQPGLFHGLVPVLGLIAAFAAVIAVLAFVYGPLVAAKVLVSIVTIALSMVCLVILLSYRWIMERLVLLEELGYALRDDLLANIAASRHALEQLAERLSDAKHREDSVVPEFLKSEFLKSVGPLVIFILHNEKSALRWGLMGLKLARNTLSLFQPRKDSG